MATIKDLRDDDRLQKFLSGFGINVKITIQGDDTTKVDLPDAVAHELGLTTPAADTERRLRNLATARKVIMPDKDFIRLAIEFRQTKGKEGYIAALKHHFVIAEDQIRTRIEELGLSCLDRTDFSIG